MRTIYPPTTKVKAARRFGQGILPSHPTYRTPATAADAAWWALETARSEDSHYDRLYAASEAGRLVEAGLVG
jgi:hypothetical protein